VADLLLEQERPEADWTRPASSAAIGRIEPRAAGAVACELTTSPAVTVGRRATATACTNRALGLCRQARRRRQVLYYEGSGAPSLGKLGIRVSDPQGAGVRVRGYAGDLRYDAPGGVVGRAVGTFDAATPGDYQVTVGGEAEGAQVAVGESFVAKTVAAALAVVALVFLTLGGSLVLVVVTLVRRSRASNLAG
jgi:hypothetical protein